MSKFDTNVKKIIETFFLNATLVSKMDYSLEFELLGK
jgi:hypothetical protein